MPGKSLAFRLVRLLGFDVEIDLTALLLIAFFVFPLATNSFPHRYNWSSGEIWFAALLIGFLTLGSILIHELSHAFCGMAVGAKVKRVRLFIFGGFTQFHSRPTSQARDFLISMAGPISNLALAGLFFMVQKFTESETVLHVAGFYLTFINLGLGIFNLLPGFPMDGGQALRSGLMVISGREGFAAIIVALSGCLVGAGLGFLAVRALFENDFFSAIWSGLIAFWIISGSLQQFYGIPNYQPRNPLTRLVWSWKGFSSKTGKAPPLSEANLVPVSKVLSPPKASYGPATTVKLFLQDSALKGLQEIEDVAIISGNHLVGLVTRAMALAIPENQQYQTQLFQICAAPANFLAVRVNDDLGWVVRAMSIFPNRPATVFQTDGAFAGLVTRSSLKEYLQTEEPARTSAVSGPGPRPSNPYL